MCVLCVMRSVDTNSFCRALGKKGQVSGLQPKSLSKSSDRHASHELYKVLKCYICCGFVLRADRLMLEVISKMCADLGKKILHRTRSILFHHSICPPHPKMHKQGPGCPRA